jgi:hypothetical protein
MTDQSAAHPADDADALQPAPSDGATACAAVLGAPGADRSGVVEELRGVVAGPVLTLADERTGPAVPASAVAVGVEKLVESLGITWLSKSQVSEMAKELDGQMADFRHRR